MSSMTRASTPARSSSDSGIDATRATARATMSSRSGEPAAGTTGASSGDLAQAAAQASGVDDVTRAPAALRTTLPPLVILGVAGSSPVSHPCFVRASRPEACRVLSGRPARRCAEFCPGFPPGRAGRARLASTTTPSPRARPRGTRSAVAIVSGSSRDGRGVEHPRRQDRPRCPGSGAEPSGAHEPVERARWSLSAP